MKSTNSYFNGILVNGIFEYPIEPIYCIKMVLSLANMDYESLQKSLEEVKNEYMGKLVDEGLMGKNNGNITENDLAYGMMGYEKEGTVIQYETTSLAMVKKFLSVRSPGVVKSDAIFWVKLSDTEMAEYSKKAYENAKEKAKKIAANLGKDLGEPIFIEDFQVSVYMEGFYHTDMLETREYQVIVGFEIK